MTRNNRFKLSVCHIAWIVYLLSVNGLYASDEVDEPTGYRLDYYDDTVPETLKGATRVTAIDIVKLQSTQDVLIVDVIPEHRRPDTLPEGQLWFPVDHEGVAGALWLPDVGYGALSGTTEQYFRNHLKAATDSNLSAPVVFYCRINCWMSWNAAKRALSYGYTTVFWFADGIDDWRFEGLETANLTPAPGVRH